MSVLPEPFAVEHLDVGDGHALYLEQSGNPDGPPALFLHGGPGGGCAPRVRGFFDPDHYRIVLFDQRGAGQSRPNVAEDFDAAMHENNTPKLIADIERIRQHLGLERWPVVLGGSWGSTLALAYAQAHPDRVDALVLRGIFTFERDEVDGLFRNGRTADHYPAEWERYRDFARTHRPEESDLVRAYRSLLDDEALRERAAQEGADASPGERRAKGRAEFAEALDEAVSARRPLRPRQSVGPRLRRPLQSRLIRLTGLS